MVVVPDVTKSPQLTAFKEMQLLVYKPHTARLALGLILVVLNEKGSSAADRSASEWDSSSRHLLPALHSNCQNLQKSPLSSAGL